MPYINAPIQTYEEFQYLLKKATSFLKEKEYLNLKPKVSEEDKAFLNSLGLITFEDLILMPYINIETNG